MTTTFKSMPMILHECERMSSLIAPELNAAPFYCVRTPLHYPATDAQAYVTPGHVDFAIREMLIRRGDWRGPGNLIAFCASMPLESALATTIHEAAHLLPFRPPVADHEPTVAERSEQHATVIMQLTAAINDEPGWKTHHDLPFIRRAIHLHYRAWQLGFNPCLHRANVSGWQYGTSPSWKYMFALADEPERLQHATFAEIEATEPPDAFTALFRSDRAYWRSNHPNYEGNLS